MRGVSESGAPGGDGPEVTECCGLKGCRGPRAAGWDEREESRAAGGAPWHRRAGEQVNQGDRGEARGQEGVPPRPHRSQAAVLHRGGSAPQGTLAVAGDAWLSQMGEEEVTGGKSEKPCPSGDPAEPRCPLASPRKPGTPGQPLPRGQGRGTARSPSGRGPRPSSAAARCRELLAIPSRPPAQLAQGPGTGRGANLIAQMVL